jgi:hypothetical protein
MPDEIITLVPNIGTGLLLNPAVYNRGVDTDWGDHVIDPSLAQGADVVGGIPGIRRREPSEATVPIHIRASTATAYVAAAEALADAATRLSLHGGTLTYQLDFGSGELSEELQTTVYTASLSPEDGWRQVHKKASLVVLSITRDPAWINVEDETVGQVLTSTAAATVIPITCRGNLPGPATIAAIDHATQTRRYWELGGAFTQYQAADSYHYVADQFTLLSGTLEADADAIDAQAVELANVIPTPQEICRLSDLTNIGTYAIKLRVKGSTEDSRHFVRVSWRQNAGGPWREVGAAEIPGDATEFFMVDCGVLRNYIDSNPGFDGIDLRVDGFSDEATSAVPISVDSMFLVPAEFHVVARGIAVEQPPLENDIFDDWADEDEGNTAIDYASTDPWGNAFAPAVAWTELETDGTAAEEADVHWLAKGGGGIIRSGADDSTTNAAKGSIAVLGATPANDFTNITASLWHPRVHHKGGQTTSSIVALAVRFEVNASALNGLFLGLMVRRKNDGSYKRSLNLWKFTGTTPTVTKIKELWSADGRDASADVLTLSVNTSGGWEAFATGVKGPSIIRKSGTDTVLATGNALESGRVGVYSLIQSDNETYAFTEAGSISGSAEATTSVYPSVIRSAGLGAVHEGGAYSDAALGGSRVEIPYVVGPRPWLPPGTGELVSIARRGDSAEEADTGFADSTTITVAHQPAWATISDALE